VQRAQLNRCWCSRSSVARSTAKAARKLAQLHYGTDGFATALAGATERDALREAIARSAERIVYDYGARDRAHLYAQLGAASLRLRDRTRGEERALETHEADDLLLLTSANELDVALHASDAALRAAIAAWFERLLAHRPGEAARASRVPEQRAYSLGLS
jgi:hypothetical protein